VTLNRVVTEPYTIPETNVTLKTGTKIVIPVHAIHYDAKYYPDPDAFDPERFSDENARRLRPNTYMPFGDGPRFCIGTRVHKTGWRARSARPGTTFAAELNAVRSCFRQAVRRVRNENGPVRSAGQLRGDAVRQDPDPGEVRYRQFRHHTREHLAEVSETGRLSRILGDVPFFFSGLTISRRISHSVRGE